MKITFKDFEKFIAGATEVYLSLAAVKAQDNAIWGIVKYVQIKENNVLLFLQYEALSDMDPQMWEKEKRLTAIQILKQYNPEIKIVDADVEV